jgi:hypothetical protein
MGLAKGDKQDDSAYRTEIPAEELSRENTTLSGTTMKFDQETIGRLIRHESFLITFGKLTFRDAFGNPHWTTFCFAEPPPLPNEFRDMPNCASYGNMDRQ